MRSGVATLQGPCGLISGSRVRGGTEGQGTPLATAGGTRVPSCGSSQGACEGIPELSRAEFIHWLLPGPSVGAATRACLLGVELPPRVSHPGRTHGEDGGGI